MMEMLTIGNIAAYSAQVVCVAALAGLVWAVLRIHEASVRYTYWRLIVALCLVLPLVQGRQLPSAAAAATMAMVETQLGPPMLDPAAGDPLLIDWRVMVLPLLVAGVLVRLLWVAVSLVRLRRLRRLGERVAGSEIHAELQEIIGTQCEIRYVERLRQPVTFGLRRPVILLPASLAQRSAEIQRAVLSHELFHVKRRDWGWLLVEELVCAALWFNPAVWWMVSRVHLAREVVVDELAVLATGRRRAYVEALLTFADETSLAPVAAFGGRRQLFDRLVLLSKEAVMSSHRLVCTCAVMTAALAAGSWQAMEAFPLTASQPQVVEQHAPGPLEQRANPITPENPIPRRVNYEAPMYPGEAQAAGARGSVTLMITLDELGRVAEARRARLSLTSTNPPVSLTSSGSNPEDMERSIVHRSVDQSNAVRAIAAAFTDAAMRSVQGWRYDPPAAAPISFPVVVNFSDGAVPADMGPIWVEGALRVGSHIRTPTKLRDVRPVYPPIAQAAGVSGVVIAEARIGADGSVEDARVLRSIPLLDQAALDAVMQWRFTPTLLNGQAVPVIMTVTVNFTLHPARVEQLEGTPPTLIEAVQVTPGPRPPLPAPPVVQAVEVAPDGPKPHVIKEVKPVYPREALAANVEGTVETEVTIGVDGKVTDARVIRSIPVFDEAALAAVRQWEFSPLPRPVAVNIELSFSTKRKGGRQ